jgi:hypothetical protein
VCVGRGELESVAMEEEGGASGGGTRSKKNDTSSDKSFSGAIFSIYELQLTIIILCAVPSTLMIYHFFEMCVLIGSVPDP